MVDVVTKAFLLCKNGKFVKVGDKGFLF